MNAPTIVVCLGVFALSTLGHILPGFTRPDVFFGVTVDPAFRTTDAARRILRDYRIALWCSAIAAGAFLWALDRPGVALPGVALLIYVIGTCGAQVASHRRALIHATTRSTIIEVDLSAPKEYFPGGLLVALLPFVVLIGLGLWAVPHMDRLPDRLPVHWGFSGPNRWVITSSRAIIGLLVIHAFVCLLLTASAWGVLRWSRHVSVSGPSAAAERRFRRGTVLLILTTEYFTILPPIFSLLLAPALAMKVWSVALLVTIFAFVISLMRAGQGGARRTMMAGRPIGDRTADARWIGGLIYFNPTDPALLVEKRMGIGWTLNLGNPWSWVPLIVATVIVVSAPILVQGASNSAVTRPLVQPDDRGEPLKSRSASPGTEESLRRYILSLEEGRPNYQEMSPQLAASVKLQLPKIMTIIAGLGDLKSLTYDGTDSDGSDVYVAAFARGRLEWHVGPLVDGKVTHRYFHPLPD
jgi:uncharacterized membrane protein